MNFPLEGDLITTHLFFTFRIKFFFCFGIYGTPKVTEGRVRAFLLARDHEMKTLRNFENLPSSFSSAKKGKEDEI
jgi:hypothetical protein